VVFHGIGYLSRYFLRYFKDWDANENYFIAPQAPSLYYLSDAYKHIGACWLTREHTGMQMENLMNYLDVLHERETLNEAGRLCLLGYSQGVSVLCRWVAKRKLKCSRLILFAGRVPDELQPQDFAHLDPKTRVEVIIGGRDPFLERESWQFMQARLRSLFGDRLVITEFDGGHEFRPSMVTNS
jgi:predicted esterase